MSTRAARADGSPARPERRLSKFFGWFSLGLGVPQIVMPGNFARLIGARDDDRTRTCVRAVGVREIATGIGILGSRRRAGWMWARVAGDAMDLELLGAALGSRKARADRIAAATGAVAVVTVGDVLTSAALSLSQEPKAEERGMRARAAVTVRRSREDVYRLWHDFRNLPQFMYHLESVEPTGDGRSHWKAKAPLGRTIEWDAEVVEDRPNELIAWRSTKGAGNSGTVRFAPAPGERGTEIHLDMRYDPPAGPVGATVAKLFGEEPGQQARDDLRRFKQVVETGIIVRSEGSPEGPAAPRLLKQRPAQPLPAGGGK
jgi:uncharacterized membrane protein